MGGLGGRRRRSHATRLLPPRHPSPHGGVQLLQRHVRTLRPGLRPHAHQLRSRDPRRHPQIPPLRRSGRRHHPRPRRLALRRTRRRPVPRRTLPQNVRRRPHAGLPPVQAHLRSHQPHEPQQAHRRPRDSRRPPPRRRLQTLGTQNTLRIPPTITAPSPQPPCAA